MPTKYTLDAGFISTLTTIGTNLNF